MNMSILNLNEFFSEMVPCHRWTIAEPSLAQDVRYGITMATDGPLRKSWPSVNCIEVSVRVFNSPYRKNFEKISKLWARRIVLYGLANDENHANLLAKTSFINNQTTNQDSRITVSLMPGQKPIGQIPFKNEKKCWSKCTCLKNEETLEHFIGLCQFYKRGSGKLNPSLIHLASEVEAGNPENSGTLVKFCLESQPFRKQATKRTIWCIGIKKNCPTQFWKVVQRIVTAFEQCHWSLWLYCLLWIALHFWFIEGLLNVYLRGHIFKPKQSAFCSEHSFIFLHQLHLNWSEIIQTDHSPQIQTGKEPLRSKRMIT